MYIYLFFLISLIMLSVVFTVAIFKINQFSMKYMRAKIHCINFHNNKSLKLSMCFSLYNYHLINITILSNYQETTWYS